MNTLPKLFKIQDIFPVMSFPLTVFKCPFSLVKNLTNTTIERHLIISVRTVVCLLLFVSRLANGPIEKSHENLIKKMFREQNCLLSTLELKAKCHCVICQLLNHSHGVKIIYNQTRIQRVFCLLLLSTVWNVTRWTIKYYTAVLNWFLRFKIGHCHFIRSKGYYCGLCLWYIRIF